MYFRKNPVSHVENPHGLLPPGEYIYSNQLPTTMKFTSPSYSIVMEPIFFDHLMLHLNQNIRVVTVTEALVGKLTGVAIDHLQLTINGENYHIRYPYIIYFKKE